MANTLPPLYASWMTQVLSGPLPEETKATCQQCAMCPPAPGVAAPALASAFFNPQTKCCTYLPRLPNFLVGHILADNTSDLREGRASVEQRIQRRVAVTPLGLEKDTLFRLLYRAGNTATFGKSRTLRCPHYLEEGGRCGIWRYRESTCLTWFCKYERGAVGLRFWHTLRQLLWTVEESLTRWCIQQLDLGTEALRLLLIPAPQFADPPQLESQDLDGTMDLTRYQMLWGTWAGREREFYRACAALVTALTWQEIVALCGPELTVLIRLTQAAYHDLCSTAIPPVLQARPLKEVRRGLTTSQVVTYNGFDPLQLPTALLDILPAFDGSPLEHVRQKIEAEAQIVPNETLIRKLVDFEVLGPSGADACALTPTKVAEEIPR